MKSLKLAILAGTALAGLVVAEGAFAQSAGSQAVEEVIVRAKRGPKTVSGAIVQENIEKSRATVTQELLASKTDGQTVINALNIVPGVNFVNSDPYGASGGNLRMRGFDGARVSLTLDGMPVNDTGNYAMYTNQLIDPELVDRVVVNIGTTDIDSPTASAVGGTVNILTRKPKKTFSVETTAAYGSYNRVRGFVSVDTGEFGPWNTSAMLAVSYQSYDKFRGPGDLERKQVNAEIYQPLNGSDFIKALFHYNENRNFSYRNNLTRTDVANLGWKADNDPTCTRVPAVAGTADLDTKCSNFYGVRRNPSDTGNVRLSGKFTLAPGLVWTIDPSFQYTLANGGGYTNVKETDARLVGNSNAKGVDLNGDGDTLDTVGVYSPNNTNTHRYMVTSSLIWDINDTNRVRAAVTWDYGRHRQTAEWSKLDANGNPADDFGAKDKTGERILGADGSFLRGRDRFSIAELTQYSLEYRGRFFDDALSVTAGVRAPNFERQLNQYCYTENGTSFFQCITAQNATLNKDGTYSIPGVTPALVAPYKKTVKYDKVLPNLAAKYALTDVSHIYVNYAEGISVPRTDNLYTVKMINGAMSNPIVEPELAKTAEVGYRYQTAAFMFQGAVWATQFKNRIVSSYDPDLNISTDRNVGDAFMNGVDLQTGFKPMDKVNAVVSLTYTDTSLRSDLRLNAAGDRLNTKGKAFVETPKWMLATNVSYEPINNLKLIVDGKYTSKRYTSDNNDDYVKGYAIVNLTAIYKLDDLGIKNAKIKVNVDNVFDENYFGNISSVNNANNYVVNGKTLQSGKAPTFSIGAPRTYGISINKVF